MSGSRVPRPVVDAEIEARCARVRRIVAAGARLANPDDVLGRQARDLLPRSTRLSPEGVELALTRHLETRPTDGELLALCRRTPSAPSAHVLLSSNVFVGALRAIAIAAAASARVEVRASRREPEMTTLLLEASGGAFREVAELAPSPGDHVWAYGSDATLRALRDELPAAVVLHAHGGGFGLGIVDVREAGQADALLARAARGLVADTIVFDQRGCLSPRLAVVLGSVEHTRRFAELCAAELGAAERAIPRGALDADELAEIARYRDTLLYAATLLPAGRGCVGVADSGAHLLLAPVGRNLQVCRAESLEAALGPLASSLTAVGYSGKPELGRELTRRLPGARVTDLGAMQRPPLDGPVDRRPPVSGEVL